MNNICEYCQKDQNDYPKCCMWYVYYTEFGSDDWSSQEFKQWVKTNSQ